MAPGCLRFPLLVSAIVLTLKPQMNASVSCYDCSWWQMASRKNSCLKLFTQSRDPKWGDHCSGPLKLSPFFSESGTPVCLC